MSLSDSFRSRQTLLPLLKKALKILNTGYVTWCRIGKVKRLKIVSNSRWLECFANRFMPFPRSTSYKFKHGNGRLYRKKLIIAF